MSPEERAQLVALLVEPQRWCQGVEARDGGGHAVTYSDAGATAWDLTGAACRLFGWQRARQLFVQLDRHLRGSAADAARKVPRTAQRDSAIAAMVALQTWNDDAQTTHAELLARLRSLPVEAAGDNKPSLPVGEVVAEWDEG